MKIKRGGIYLVNLDPTVGNEIRKTRPVVVVSNNVANEFSGTLTIIPLTSQNLSKVYPFEVLIPPVESGLDKTSKAKADQIRTIDRSRLIKVLGQVDRVLLSKINSAIRIHLDL